MTRPLDSRLAAISGGTGGIGSAIVHELTEAGAVACSLDPATPPPDTQWITTDVSDEASVQAAMRTIDERFGRLDILVHAAGVSHDAVVWKMPVEQWDRIHRVNLRGAFLLLRYGIPLMRRGGGGRIVLIGSINGSRGKFGTSAYSASKAGLIGLARSVARETGRFNIRVNVVEPGWVKTPLTDRLPREVVDQAVADSAIGRILDPADVARTVLFLCGPGGDAITGQILRVDGGQHMG